MNDIELGWSPFFEAGFQPFAQQGYCAARVAQEHRNGYLVLSSAHGELHAELAGAFRHRATERRDLPAVGDWVAIDPRPGEGRATVHGVLPRSSFFSRKAPGNAAEEQAIAANVDLVLLVTGLDDNFNTRRIERYLVLAWESGARAVIVLNKADLCDQAEHRRADVEAIAFGTPIVVVSAETGTGIEELRTLATPGRTLALLGSSGVGKSTLVNAIAGYQAQRTGAVSDSVGKGRHTTTVRELLMLPNGGLVIDTPGMRELGLWSGEEALEGTFEDVDAIVAQCRFSDCGHNSEPGCAVNEALANGTLPEERWRSYRKLQREIAYLERRTDSSAAALEKQRWRAIHKAQREHYRKKR